MIRAGGFTLIELLVTISVMVILLTMGVPLTISWINQSYINQAQHTLQQAQTLLKAKALQNPVAATDSEVAATLVSTGTQLCIYKGQPAQLSCNAGYLWQATTVAAIKLNGATSQCITLSNTASAIGKSIDSTECGTALSYEITKGADSESGTLN